MQALSLEARPCLHLVGQRLRVRNTHAASLRTSSQALRNRTAGRDAYVLSGIVILIAGNICIGAGCIFQDTEWGLIDGVAGDLVAITQHKNAGLVAIENTIANRLVLIADKIDAIEDRALENRVVAHLASVTLIVDIDLAVAEIVSRDSNTIRVEDQNVRRRKSGGRVDVIDN